MTQKKKLTKQDFELELPTSLRDIVEQELTDSRYDDIDHGKRAGPVTEEEVDQLMGKVYERIEREALAVYRSNEPWALKAWAYSTILRDTVADQATQPMVEQLMSPVVEWQGQQPFDPIAYYRDRLKIEHKSYKTKKGYMVTATRFVSRMGRKRHYTDDDVIEYLIWADETLTANTYYQECTRLLQFLRRLPEADKRRDLPIAMPEMPDEFYQPIFTEKEVEALIWDTVINDISGNMVVRLLVASVYGARAGELAQLCSEDIHLDGDKSTIYIRTKKRGQKKPQPIPESLVALFNVPVTPIPEQTQQYRLKAICRKARVLLPFGGGYHCFRRWVVTVVSEHEPSEISVHNFIRWSVPRKFSMLARYRHTPVEQSDRAILSKHPIVKVWEQVTPHLLALNSSYAQTQQSLNDNAE